LTFKSKTSAQNKTQKGVNLAKQKARLAGIGARAKAFIIDLFLIGMPIYYLTTYVFLGGKDDFLHNQTAIFGANLAVALICCAFLRSKPRRPATARKTSTSSTCAAAASSVSYAFCSATSAFCSRELASSDFASAFSARTR